MSNTVLDSKYGQKLLEDTCHPKTESVFKRMIIITLWHTLIFVPSKDNNSWYRYYAAELKSTVDSVAESAEFASLYGGDDKARFERYIVICQKVAELENQQWWKKQVV